MDDAPLRLWPTAAPLAHGNKPEDIPTLTAFWPDDARSTGASMLVLPGGGYAHLASHEGEGYGHWLADNGIAAFVLQYRLGSAGYRHPAMLLDAARGLRIVRHLARDRHRDVKRVGVMGSSAGGHLGSTLATHFDDGDPSAVDPVDSESSRPDLGILCYPVITMGSASHAGSKKNLLGDAPSEELIADLSNERKVTAKTPPCFLWHTADDNVVPVENSFLFANALREVGVKFSLHIFEHGAHGLGLGRPDRPAPPWAEVCLYWLREHKFVS